MPTVPLFGTPLQVTLRTFAKLFIGRKARVPQVLYIVFCLTIILTQEHVTEGLIDSTVLTVKARENGYTDSQMHCVFWRICNNSAAIGSRPKHSRDTVVSATIPRYFLILVIRASLSLTFSLKQLKVTAAKLLSRQRRRNELLSVYILLSCFLQK